MIKSVWQSTILNGDSWNQAVHDGTYSVQVDQAELETKEVELAKASASLTSVKSAPMELTVYTKTGLGDGQQANNPWLQELPDPITRTSWDNYLLMSRADAENLGIREQNHG